MLFETSPQKHSTTTTTIELPQPPPIDRIIGHHKLIPKNRIKQPPKTIYTWIHSTCQAACSTILRRSTLSSGTNLLTTDPTVVDLLLSSIHMASTDKKKRHLFPKCPISATCARKIISSFPETLLTRSPEPAIPSPNPSTPTTPLSTGSIETAFTTCSTSNTCTTKDKHPRLTKPQQTLLKWLLTTPPQLTTITPKTFPHLLPGPLKTLTTTQSQSPFIKTFLLTSQPPQKETLFNYHCSRTPHLPPIPLYHGTSPARLFSILTTGLKVCSGTRLQTHGRAMGSGIYLAQDAATSLCYSSPGEGWRGSGFCGGLRVLLGCELAGYQRGRGTYVVDDAGCVVVRFVFLILGDVAAFPDGVGMVAELERIYGVLRGGGGVQVSG